MRKIIIIATVFCAWFCNAQDITFQTVKSEIFKDEYKKSNLLIADTDADGNLTVARSFEKGSFSSGMGYYFEKYDANLKLIKNKEYDLEQLKNQKYNTILGQFSMGSELKFIEAYFDLDTNEYVFLMHSFNIVDFSISKKELFRLTHDDVEIFGSFSLVDFAMDAEFKHGGAEINGCFYGLESADGVAITLNEGQTLFSIAVNLSGKTAECVKAYLFDAAGNLKVKQDVKPVLYGRKYQPQTISIDDENIYLLAKCLDSESKKKSDGGKYKYELKRLSAQGQKTSTLDVGTHFVHSLKSVLQKDRLLYLGLYSDEDEDTYKGVAYFELNSESLEVKQSKFNPFSEQFILDKYGKKKDKELKSLSFHNIILTPDSNIIFNAEEISHGQNNTIMNLNNVPFSPVGGFSNAPVTLSFGNSSPECYSDIISTRLDANGNLLWARNINKNQKTLHSDKFPYLSYSTLFKDDEIYFFINADEEVKKISNGRIEFMDAGLKFMSLNVIRIKANGDFDYRQVLSEDIEAIPFMAGKGISVKNWIYFLGRDGSQKQLLKVTL